jgi:hypothetical protein
MTFDDVALIADRCFGELGLNTVHLWKRYNDAYFDGTLVPTPVLYVPTSPYGHWVGQHVADRNIYLMRPGPSRSWGFVRGVLLHEMIHQGLAQAGKNPKHDGNPWCSEIMRISHYFDRNIWAGKYTVIKVEGKSVRANMPRPKGNRARILDQDEISKWPHSIDIEPPDTSNYK